MTQFIKINYDSFDDAIDDLAHDTLNDTLYGLLCKYVTVIWRRHFYC